jgi:hypothetical protein
MLEHIYTNKVFNFDKFEEYIKQNKEEYQNKKPFSYDAISELFSEEALNGILDSFPSVNDESKWDKRDDKGIQVKLRTNWKTELDIPPKILEVIQTLQSGRFCRLLSEYTGIDGLMPDFWFGGGGLNQIMPGGELAIHLDGTYNDDIKMYRRVNIIVFLNKEWEDEYGGHLEFWDIDKTACFAKVKPDYNTLAMFNTSDLTEHGHPTPLSCPEGMSRKSLILYFYTSARPDNEVILDKVHRAIFTPRDELGQK